MNKSNLLKIDELKKIENELSADELSSVKGGGRLGGLIACCNGKDTDKVEED